MALWHAIIVFYDYADNLWKFDEDITFCSKQNHFFKHKTFIKSSCIPNLVKI